MVVSVSDSGGFEGSNKTLTLEVTTGSVLSYRYEHYTIKDRFIITYEGSTLFDTGFTGGNATGTFSIPQGTSNQIQIVIATDTSGTAWNYDVSVEPENCPHDTKTFAISASGGPFQYNTTDMRCHGTGTITIGKSPGINPLITVTGQSDASYSNNDVKITGGTVRVNVGGVSQALFTGDFTIPFNTGISSALTDTGGTGQFDLAGLPVQVNKLSVFSNEVRAGVTFDLPVDLGPITLGSLTLGDLAVIFNSKGTFLGVSSKVSIPDYNFSFFGIFDVAATGQEVSYTQPTDTLKMQGKYELSGFSKNDGGTAGTSSSPGTKITLDLSGQNFVQVQNGVADVKGTLKAETEIKVGAWSLKELQFDVDTIADTVAGTVKIGLPFAGRPIDVSGTLGFKTAPHFELDQIGVSVDNINKPLATYPAIWLQKLGGAIKHWAPSDTTATALEGNVAFTVGPRVNNVALATLDLTATISSENVTGTGVFTIVDPLILRATGTAELNWNKGFLKYNGTFTAIDGFLTASNQFIANSNFDFSFGGLTAINVPKSIPGVGGQQLSSASYLVNFTNDSNMANDYVAGWGSFTISKLGLSITIGAGAQMFFDGHSKFFGMNNIPVSTVGALAAFNQSGNFSDINYSASFAPDSFGITAGKPWIMLFANWDTANTGVTVRITKPDGTVVNEADFAAHNIAIVDDFSNQFNRTVLVKAPAAGAWNIEVVNSTGLGQVNYSAGDENATPVLSLTNATVSGSQVTISYNMSDPDNDANLQLFIDTDGTGFDGRMIEDSIAEADGPGTYVWDSAAIEPGTYHIYGVLSDGVNPFVMDYASQTVTLTASADLAVSMTGPSDGHIAGTNATYTIQVDNLGPSTASSVQLVDMLPGGSTFISSTRARSAETSDELTFDLGNIVSGGHVSFDVEMLLRHDFVGVITKEAGHGNDDIASAFDLEGSFTLDTDANIRDAETIPHVSVEGTGDGTKDYYSFIVETAGRAGHFDIDFGSGGSSGSFDAMMQLLDSTGSQLVSDDDSSTDPGSSSSRDPEFDYTFADAGTYYVVVSRYSGFSPINANSTYTLQVSLEGEPVSGTASSSAVNSVGVTSATYDSNGTNNQAFIDTVLGDPLPPVVDLKVEATNLPTAVLHPADDFTYDLVVTNTGTSDASSVVLSEAVANSVLGRLGGTTPQGSVNTSGNVITYTIGTIAAGASVTVTVNGRALSSVDVLSSSSVISNGLEQTPADNEQQRIIDVEAGGLTPADISVDLAIGARNASGQVTATVTVANAGAGIASNIQVSIPVPAGTSFVSASGVQGTYDQATGIWDVGSMRDGLTRTFDIVFEASSDAVLTALSAELISSNVSDPDSTPGNGLAGEDDMDQGITIIGAVNEVTGDATSQTLNGTPNQDLIQGDAGNDTINGLAHNDFLYGGAGNDTVNGGAGNDYIEGDGGIGAGTGNDNLDGGAGSDVIVGGAGNDILDGGSTVASEIDVLYGGVGNDTYRVNSTAAALDIVFEGAGFPGGAGDVDTIISEGEFFWDFYDVGEILTIAASAGTGTQLVSGKGDSTMNGNDFGNILLTYGGTNEVNPGKGIDTIGLNLYGLAASFNGTNTVKLNPGDDTNYIYDFESGIDKIDTSGYSRFADGAQMLANVADTPWGSFIWMGEHEGEHEYIGIVGLHAADLDVADFVV